MPKWYVHINQHAIRHNINAEDKIPVIAIKRGKHGRSTYCDELTLPAESKVLYRSGIPLLKCGARVIIECPEEPVINA